MKNCVQIQTAERAGSGVILSCDVDPKKRWRIKEDEKSYIVFTNYHVVQDIVQDGKDKKKNVRLNIMDINGEKIERRMIRHIYVESGSNYGYESDVAALLVIVKDCCKIPCCNDVYMGDHSKETIETYGYPHIFQTNWINHDICMEGVVQKYTKDGIGLYTIKDDYHSYSNISDKSLMDGISGAPVYLTDGNKAYLVGINESVCNIGEGNNPFKMVYFLSIDRVLDWLAQQHIILYRYSARTIKILWVAKRMEDPGENDETKPEDRISLLDLGKPSNIVLVGSSGAGKSSFLNTLCQHGKQLDSVGDGQTTRNTIVYHLAIEENKPRVEISFRSKKDFVDCRLKNLRLRRYELILCQIYGMEKRDIIANPCCYLQDMIMPLSELKKKGNESEIKKIEGLTDQIIQMAYSYQLEDDEEDLESRLWKLYEESILCLKEIFVNEPGVTKETFWCRRSNEAHQRDDDQFCAELREGTGEETGYDAKTAEEELKRILTVEEGFYNIAEFYYLDEEEGTEEWDGIFNKYFLNSAELIPFDAKEQDIDIDEESSSEVKGTFLQKAKNYYGEVYETVERKLVDKGINIATKLTYSLETASSKEKNIISRCMRKVGKESLTSLVSEVNVFDRISDTYAYDVYQRKIKHFQIYDTCGYDHIEKQNLYVYFKTLFNNIKGERQNQEGHKTKRRQVDAIIYVKKLDSEKPTELEKILPIVCSMEETTPILCLFTAIDQYMDAKRNILYNIIWNKDYYEKWKNANTDCEEYIFPKSVQSLYENKKLRDSLRIPEYMKDKVIEFIQNHMVPYASKYQVNDENVIELNRNSISYILRTILQDEWNLGFVVVQKETVESEGNLEQTVTDEDVKKAIRHDLERMFEIASRTNWERRHHSTVRANFRRIYRYDEDYDKKEKDLGLNRTNIDRWDNLLEDGYTKSFLSADSATICILSKKYKLSKIKAYEIIARLKQNIITDSMGKWESNKEEGNFRSYFEKLYKNVVLGDMDDIQKNKKIDLFKRQEKITITKDQMAVFLNQVCNFKDQLDKNTEVKENMVNYIKVMIDKEFESNNNIYLSKLYEYDERFRDGIDYIDKVIRKHTDENGLQRNTLMLEILENWSRWRTSETNHP